jgi:hypothetical protein
VVADLEEAVAAVQVEEADPAAVVEEDTDKINI